MINENKGFTGVYILLLIAVFIVGVFLGLFLKSSKFSLLKKQIENVPAVKEMVDFNQEFRGSGSQSKSGAQPSMTSLPTPR